MAQQVHFTNYVGVSPGTTTMTLGGLGVCPPGYYGENIMLPGSINFGPRPTAGSMATVAPMTTQAISPAAGQRRPSMTRDPLNPYATESKLEGLRGTMRWDLLILGFGVAFAGVLGYSLYKRKRK